MWSSTCTFLGCTPDPLAALVWQCFLSQMCWSCATPLTIRSFPTSCSPAPARRWAASCFDGFLSSKKSHFWPVECVGAAIGRPPAWRSSAFSGKVFHRQTGTGEQCSPLQEFFCSLKKNCKPAICWLAIFCCPQRRPRSFSPFPAFYCPASAICSRVMGSS